MAKNNLISFSGDVSPIVNMWIMNMLNIEFKVEDEERGWDEPAERLLDQAHNIEFTMRHSKCACITKG